MPSLNLLKVPKLPPHRAAARDEGPTLLPRDDAEEHPSERRLEHYVRLLIKRSASAKRFSGTQFDREPRYYESRSLRSFFGMLLNDGW